MAPLTSDYACCGGSRVVHGVMRYCRSRLVRWSSEACAAGAGVSAVEAYRVHPEAVGSGPVGLRLRTVNEPLACVGGAHDVDNALAVAEQRSSGWSSIICV
jgi:hypothetical protein